MTKGVAILIRSSGGKVKSEVQLKEGNLIDISLVLTHLEITKLQLMDIFKKLLNQNDKGRI